jgi:hypothetical protein
MSYPTIISQPDPVVKKNEEVFSQEMGTIYYLPNEGNKIGEKVFFFEILL